MEATDYSGNPFDIIVDVVFTHTDTSDTINSQGDGLETNQVKPLERKGKDGKQGLIWRPHRYF